MAFHLAHIHDYDRFLAVDIWAHRVRVGVYSVEQSVLSELSYSTVRQNRKNFASGAIADMQWVARTIEQAMIQASQSLDRIPEDIILSFPSHEFFFDSLTTQYIRVDPTSTLTMQELDTMIKKVESDSYHRAREKARKRLGVLQDDLRLISSTITAITIDGKKITNPIGFAGGRITLTVMNVFAPASEFNIIRSVVASLWKKTISLIPTPLIFPKVIEQTEYSQDRICCIDIWYTHTTVIVSQDNEMKTFETFSVGTRMCMEMIRDLYPSLSLLQIENILCDEHEVRQSEYLGIIEEFFSYIFDMIWGFLEQEKVQIVFSDLFLHGSLFENPAVFRIFWQIFEESCGYAVRKKRLNMLVPKNFRHDEIITYGLALTASELFLVKKDPLIRILRYVLYNYE